MLDGFSFARFLLRLRAKDTIQLPPYKGSAFRGGFGWAFRRIVCTLKRSDCADCPLATACIYAYVFETRPPDGSEVLRNYRAIPRPFVIEPPLDTQRVYEPGEELFLNLLLIGRVVEYLPYFIYTFDELGNTGIGKDRGRYALEEVRDASTGNIVYRGDKKSFERNFRPTTAAELSKDGDEETASVELDFITPLRIAADGDLVVELAFHHLIRSLLRRVSTLSYFHCNKRLELDFRGLIERAERVRVGANEMRWFDWERYSTRQDARMKMGGLVGRIAFKGGLGEFMPLLRLGSMIHAGKGTSFGLGRYGIKVLKKQGLKEAGRI